MSQYLLFLVLGLGAGAVYASLSLGIVVTYQGTGVINFAAAALSAVPLYVLNDLRAGKLTLPIPWLPSFHVGYLPIGVSILIAVAVAAAFGALIELCISRPLRTAPPLAKVVAAVGVMLTLQAAVGLKYGTDARLLPSVLPNSNVKISGATVAQDRLWLIGIIVVLGAGLAFWFSRSRTGLAIQAAAENERAASFARLSPYALGMITWVLASVFTALVMCLAGPAAGSLSPSTMSLLVVPALACALLARMASLWVALIGALALGVLQSELQFLSQSKSWWPGWASHGITDAVPFVVIVVTLFVFGRSIPGRGDDIRAKLPPVILPKNRPLVIAGLTAGGVIALLVSSGTYRFGIITSLAIALICLSLVVLTGMVGQISLAQAAFAGLAGLVVSKFGTSVPFPFSMLLAALIAAVAGLIVGLPALRIRGAQLAVVTLAAAVAVQQFVFANPSLVSATTNVVPDPRLFGVNLSVRHGTDIARLQFGLLVLVIVVVVIVLTGNVMRAGTGRKMLAVRSNERAAASVGIGVPGIKLSAFVLSSFLAGLGGVLIGYSRSQLSPDSFGTFVGLGFLATAYLSGITSVSGALLAGASAALGVVYVFFDQNLHLGSYYALLTGVGLILTVLFNPIGVAGKSKSDFEKLTALIRRRSGAKKRPVVRTQLPGASTSTAPAERRQIGDVVLRAEGISVRYGGVRAVQNVSIEVRAGEVVGLIGPNGAGKTSFVDALSGFTSSTGAVHLGETDLSRQPAHRRARAGLVRTWQSGELFDDLSVLGNVQVATDVGNETVRLLSDSVRPRRELPAAVADAIRLVSLEDDVDRKPSELPLGRQKALGIARALAMEPTVLLLDEPAAGLDMQESRAFGAQLQRIAATGVGCLLIDHDMHLVMSVCDRVYVIEFGEQIASGTPEEVRRDPRVLESYLGSEQIALDDGGVNISDGSAVPSVGKVSL